MIWLYIYIIGFIFCFIFSAYQKAKNYRKFREDESLYIIFIVCWPVILPITLVIGIVYIIVMPFLKLHKFLVDIFNNPKYIIQKKEKRNQHSKRDLKKEIKLLREKNMNLERKIKNLEGIYR